MYCATTGTFLQRDPLGQPGSAELLYSDEYVTSQMRSRQSGPEFVPDLVNLYEYVRSQPMVRVDPLGLDDLGRAERRIRYLEDLQSGGEGEWSADDYIQWVVNGSKNDRETMRLGCVGLNALRQPRHPLSGTFNPQKLHPGTRWFRDFDEAKKLYDALATNANKPLLYAIQVPSTKPDGTPNMPAWPTDDGTTEVNVHDINVTNSMSKETFNFATYWPSTGMWEYMPRGGVSSGKALSDLRVKRKPNLPPISGSTYYCVNPKRSNVFGAK